MKRACLTIAFAVMASSLCLAYENDGPGYDPKAPKRAMLLGSSNSFSPPEPSDICFVATSGGDLGKEVWGKDSSYSPRGSIVIPLPIDRYFGDKAKLLKSKALPETVTLKMVVWDVDDKSSYTPAEYDEIFVNGNAPRDKKALYGVNNGLQLNTFTIDTKHIKLPKNPGETAMNTIRIDVATKGGDWVTRIDWVALEIPAAPPIVISHGIRSNEEGLAYLQACLENIGLPVHNFSYPNNGNNGIKEDALKLQEEVARAMDKFKVKSVNLVCHSMGGLKARQYAENCKNDEVLKILQIATPNAGSPIADVVLGIKTVMPTYIEEHLVDNWILGDLLNGSVKAKLKDGMIEDLAETTLKEYNQNHPFNKNIWYGIVAGNITEISFSDNPGYWIGHKWLKIFRGYPNNDAIVPLDSAYTCPANSSFSYMRMMEGNSELVNHSALVVDGVDDWLELVKPFLFEKKEITKNKAPTSGAKNKVRSKAQASIKHLQMSQTLEVKNCSLMKTGELANGTIQTIPFAILKGGDTVLMMSLSNCKQLEAKLISPSNMEYPVSVSKDGVVVYATTNTFNCVMEKPEIGEWRVELKPTLMNGVTSATYLLVQAEENDGVLIATGFDEPSRVGKPLILRATASMDGNKIGGSYSAFVMNPDGVKSVVTMKDDGIAPDTNANDGVYTASIETPSVGRYWATMAVDADSPTLFSRMCVVSGVAVTDNAEISNASASVTDNDGNGLYDDLVINFAVNTTKAGTYRVLATLADSAGNEIMEGWTSNVVCSVGMQTFPVAFDGGTIYGNGECGGYKVSSAKLLEIGEDYEAVVDERSDLFTTTAYTYQQFEHDLVAMKSGGSDSAVDVNSDGTYDRLDVTIPLYADDLAAGSYEWSASLMDADGFLLGTASGYVTFVSGQGGASISMSFDRDGIVATHKNGMYHVKNLIIWGNGRNLTIAGEYTTASYNIEDFGGELATVDLGFFLPSGWSDPLIISTNATGTTGQTFFEQGDPIYLNYAFANVANQAAVSNFVNRFTLSNGSDYSDSWIGYGLREGGWGWLGKGVAPEMLQNLPAGTYTLTCELDVDGQLPETDEFNNVVDVTFTINESLRPNLKVSSASVSKTSLVLSDSAVFHWRIENTGRAAAKKTKTSFKTWKYDSSSNTWTLKKAENFDSVPLAAGGGREFTRTISGKTFGAGEFAIGVCADGNGSLAELDESDNNRFIYFAVSKDNAVKSSSGVDWQFKKYKSSEPDSFYLSTSATAKKKATVFKAGQTIYMRCCWWNATKKAASGDMRVRVLLNGRPGIYTDRSYFNKNSWYYFTDRTPEFLQNLPAGKYTLTAVLDSENNWTEKNEKNNIKRISFTVVGTPVIYGEEAYTCALREPVSWPVSSEGTVTVKGLPPGLKYSGGAIAGKATKTGTFTVKFTSKNAAGTKTKTIKITVVDPGFNVDVTVRANGATEGMSIVSGGTIPMYTGVKQNIAIVSEPGKSGIAKSAASSVTVKGLPAGLKYSKGVISGVPAKEGTYTVKLAFKNALGWSKTFTVKMAVKTLPAFARGTFNGWTYCSIGEALGKVSQVRKATISVTKAGKITATVGSLKFTGTGWTVEADEDGLYWADLRTVRTVGSGKKAKKYTDILSIGLNPAAAWTEDQLDARIATFGGAVSLANALSALEGENALSPSNEDTYVLARRNPFGDNADAKSVAAVLAAQGTRTFTDESGLVWNVKMSSNGVATISRTTGSGKNKKTVSASAVLEVDSDAGGNLTGATRFAVLGKVIAIPW